MNQNCCYVSGCNLEEIVQNILEDIKAKKEVKLPKINLNASLIEILNIYTEKKIEKSFLETGIEEIVQTVEEIYKPVTDHTPELLLYDFLEELFERTKQIERQHYFKELVDIFYKTSQETFGPSKSLNRDIFDKLVKSFLPLVKLKLVIKELNELVTPSESSVLELTECIKCCKLLREDCYQIVQNEIGTCEYELISFELSPLSSDGFLGSYYSLKIVIKQNLIENTLGFFVKYVLTTDGAMGAMSFQTCKKEMFFYKEFTSKIRSVGAEELLKFAPKHYFSRLNDVIVLEDMTAGQFLPSDLSVPATYDWLVLITKKMSKFHACSLIVDAKMRATTGDTIKEKYGEYLDEIIFHKSKPIIGYLGAKTIVEYFLPTFSGIPTKLPLEEVKRRILIEIELLFTKFVPSDEYINVICQRDMWGGNILSKNTEDCVFVDYQLISYCPPAVDLLYMIYFNTDRETRLKYMDELINLYYSNLKQILLKFGLDLDTLCTREKFWKMVNEFKLLLILQTLAGSQVVICPIAKEIKSDPERAENYYTVNRSKDLEEAFRYDWYKIKIRDLMEDLYEIIENK